jgi:hypothetical protein
LLIHIFKIFLQRKKNTVVADKKSATPTMAKLNLYCQTQNGGSMLTLSFRKIGLSFTDNLVQNIQVIGFKNVKNPRALNKKKKKCFKFPFIKYACVNLIHFKLDRIHPETEKISDKKKTHKRVHEFCLFPFSSFYTFTFQKHV